VQQASGNFASSEHHCPSCAHTLTTAASRERRLMKDRFFQFSWRPRNASLLSAEQERDILKNLKKYSEKFAKDDDIILQQVCSLRRFP